MLTAAVIQDAPAAFDLPATLERAESLLRQAHARGARLVVFPEAFLGGYPKGADFGVTVGSRSEEGRAWFQRYHDAALRIPGPELDQLLGVVRELKLTAVLGAVERDPGGTLYCAALTLDPSGLCNHHRKVMPTAMERVIWGFGDDRGLRAVETRAGRVATAICWESYLPQLRLRLYRDHVAFYCAPTVDDRDTWQHTMRHVAMEGRCFVLSACQHARRRDYPEDFRCQQGDQPDAVMIRGGSCIVDPFGRVLAGPVYDESTILVADLDPRLITRGKFDLDVTGHYARPDLFD